MDHEASAFRLSITIRDSAPLTVKMDICGGAMHASLWLPQGLGFQRRNVRRPS